MSSSGPRREVAYRLFAEEFNDATYTYAESDEERAPNYLVTPSGARVNRLFVVGVLTEVEEVSDDVVRARVVDPTGAFVIYAGQYQPDALAFFERAEPPVFVAVTGKARTFQPEGSDRVFTSLRPESVNEVDADTRDRWVVQTAEHTLERVAIFGLALEQDARGSDLQAVLAEASVQPGLASGIPRAIEEYGTTRAYLASIQEMAIDVARLVAGEVDAVERRDIDPDEGGDVTLDTSFADITLTDASVSGETQTPAPEADESDREAAGTEAEATPSEADAVEAETQVSDSETARDESDPADEPPRDESEAEDEPPAEDPEEVVETDEMYELSEEERAEVEENFDVGFESGAEIGEPDTSSGSGAEPGGAEDKPEASTEAVADEETAEPQADVTEAGGETETDAAEASDESEPDAEESDETDLEAEPGGETDLETEPSDETDLEAEPEDQTGPDTEATAGAETGAIEADETGASADLSEAELEDAVIETMKSAADSDGIDRAALVDLVLDEYAVDEDDIDAAIQSALLGGRCFESGDDRLKPI